ncbi:universal stress protein [Leptolyngbya sp. PCC 6406]|uniref:universal stress protein n=1 Tax=Leptolyngbya sp. PCC 6406 TaxID=1173264 RepID=UPI0002ACF9E1|nr:universal stress protein [Leptolyngbya sp. PCC 6406]
MFKTVLFPVDMSPEAQQAASLAVDLVKQHQSRLVLLSVVENHPDAPSEQSSPAAVAQLLEQVKTLFSQQGVESEALEREGQPAFVICDVADELEVDLIVMGCRGLGLIEDGQSESVTNRVINLAPCPVLVVP